MMVKTEYCYGTYIIIQSFTAFTSEWDFENLVSLNEYSFCSRVFQEMLYGIQTGFGSPQVPVAELLARPAPTLLSPTPARPKSSNFLQVPDIESPRWTIFLNSRTHLFNYFSQKKLFLLLKSNQSELDLIKNN